jgi:hypothetical protein
LLVDPICQSCCRCFIHQTQNIQPRNWCSIQQCLSLSICGKWWNLSKRDTELKFLVVNVKPKECFWLTWKFRVPHSISKLLCTVNPQYTAGTDIQRWWSCPQQFTSKFIWSALMTLLRIHCNIPCCNLQELRVNPHYTMNKLYVSGFLNQNWGKGTDGKIILKRIFGM